MRGEVAVVLAFGLVILLTLALVGIIAAGLMATSSMGIG